MFIKVSSRGVARLAGAAVVSIMGVAPAFASDKDQSDGPNAARTDVIVTSKKSIVAVKSQQVATVDTIPYDDVASLAPDGGVAEQLRLLPGVTTEDEGDSPRFVIIRGIAPDLNQTKIDGITLATIGNDGEGSRQINLQIIPAELAQRTDIYKTFTAEQDGGAIGGVVNLVTRSALDLRRRYLSLDAFGIYSGLAGPDGRFAAEKSWRHWGGGFKGVYSNRFGSDGQFGLTLTGRYQSRVRNSGKWWQVVKTYFDRSGKNLAGPDTPGWDGRIVPGDHSFGSYTNRLQTAGGSAKLEWQVAPNVRAALLGFGFRMWESSSMNKNDIFTARTILGTTPTGGRSSANSLYTRYRFDNWDKKTLGGIASLGWADDVSSLQLRAGYTKALFDNQQPSLVARVFPTGVTLDWEAGDDDGEVIPRATGVSNPNIGFTTGYRLSGAQMSDHSATETLSNVRLDYARNTGPRDRGAGLALGMEFRRLDLDRDLDVTIYRTGANVDAYLYDPHYRPIGSPISFPFINYQKLRAELLPTLTVDAASSATQRTISDYRYVERLWTPYVSFHYGLGAASKIIAGLRYDLVDFDAYQPYQANGVLQAGLRRRGGGYAFLLPSLHGIHDFDQNLRLRASYSRTLGRPVPGDIARVESVTCGLDDDGDTDCVISRGNIDLRPRQSDNFDIGIERYLGGDGIIGLTAFAKRIKDDIFLLRSVQQGPNGVTSVREPMNAESSRLYGIEFQISKRDVELLGVRFDPFFNATVLSGSMRVATDSGTRTIDRLMYQPNFIANGGVKVQLPAIDGAFSTTVSHRTTALRGIGALPQDDSARMPLTVVNAALWHVVGKRVTLKYELANVFNSKPTMAIGERLNSVSQIDYYGRSAFLHVILR
ncbi:outer membrane beta-barrel protein [Roseomonas aeriglobus]|nr:outer membrane beta-barrel protein [Roseomonas aeriglobus]